ncbi:MAG: iron-sulfur cluster assembly accessory protein [Candidatus Abawacabacteria bacterium]|nr:iron-sulfur cluster assembly accessory protein [Candidatus Abawacabacteria bacterium]
MPTQSLITFSQPALAYIRKIMAKAEKANAYLRFGLRAGGCAGFKYYMGVEETIGEHDIVIKIEDLTLLIDTQELPMIEGTMVDFEENLNGSGLKMQNPNFGHRCGCGKSVG